MKTKKANSSKKNTSPGSVKPLKAKAVVSKSKVKKKEPLHKKEAKNGSPTRPIKKTKKVVVNKPSRLYVFDQFHQKLPFLQNLNSRKTLGLDIDPEKIRYVVVKRYKDEVQILEWGVQTYPTEEKDRDKAMQIALENIKSKVYKHGMQVNVSIFSPEISTRQLVFPEMKKQSDLKQAIFHKNESDLQNFSDKSIWAYEIIDRFHSEDLVKLRISIIVAPEEVVHKYIRIFDAANMEINHLVARPLAIQAAYRRMVFRPGRDLLIDIGYDLTQMCYLKHGHAEFIRNVSIGSRNLEVTIHSGAEENKDTEQGGLDKKASGPQSADALRNKLLNRIQNLKTKQNPVLHTFFSEILRSLAFFQGKDVNQYIERIFVTGYGIRKESLLPYLKSRLTIPLFILAPQFEDRPKRTIEFGEFFSTIGTTVQNSDFADISPKDYKSRFIFKKLNFLFGFGAILLAAALSFISYSQDQLIHQKQVLEKNYEIEYQKLNPIEGKYMEVLEAIGEVNQKNNELKGYIQAKPPIVEVMRLFSNETPKYIRIEKIDFVHATLDVKNIKDAKFKNNYKYQIDVQGQIISENLMADVTLINFVNKLLKLKYFKHIELLNKLKQKTDQEMSFGIRLYL